MTSLPKQRGPLEEHVTVRIDARLAEELDQEQARREAESGLPLSRGALVRLLIRVGLATVRGQPPIE